MSTTPLYIHPHSALLPNGTSTANAVKNHIAITSSSVHPASHAKGASASGSSTFGMVLDTINPLQHIPVVSSAYRSLTGSQISPVSQIAGDTLYGALLGGGTLVAAAVSGVASSADASVQTATGTGIAGHVMSALGVTPASSATSPSTPSNGITASTTPATSSTTASPKAATAATVAATTANALHNPDKAAAHYQRAKVLDSAHQYLAAMGTHQAVRKPTS